MPIISAADRGVEFGARAHHPFEPARPRVTLRDTTERPVLVAIVAGASGQPEPRRNEVTEIAHHLLQFDIVLTFVMDHLGAVFQAPAKDSEFWSAFGAERQR